MRAGKVVSGDFAAEKAVKGGEARLVIADASVSDNTLARYTGYAERAGIPLVKLEDMGRAIGRPERMVAAVTDDGFAQMMIKINAKTDGGVD